MSSDGNPDTKSRHVSLTNAQWDKVVFVARLIEHKKGLPPYSLSRQAAFQMMVDALPDPPEGWTVDAHVSTINFEDHQLNSLMAAASTDNPANQASIPERRIIGTKAGMLKRIS